MFRKISPTTYSNAGNKCTRKDIAKKKTYAFSKIFIFRVLVFGSLLLTAGLCGFLAFFIVDREESESFETQYNSLSDQILQSTHDRLLRARSASNEVATSHSIHFPNSTSWPKVFMEGYDDIYEHVRTMGNVIVISIGPIVKPKEIPEFEDYVRSIYQSDPYNFQNPNLDLGVYGIGPNGMYHDTTGEVAFSQYNIIAPLLNIGNITRNADALLYNLHSERARAEAIDACYECSLETKGPCAVMTDILKLVTFDELLPNTIIFRAVYPFHEPDRLVGFQVVSVSWKDFLTGLVPDYVCGVEVVLSTDTQVFTYSLCDGLAILKCVGDCHEKNYESYRSKKILSFFDVKEKQPHQYLLQVYPSQTLYDDYHSTTPWVSALVVVSVVLFTSLVFILYDFLVAKDSREKQQVLEAKRRFVRFVSHEIRTPLSTLVLGLKLLGDNVDKLPADVQSKPNLKQMAVELEGCSNVAVMVLNDLLQYDKIETGSMKLDLTEIRIWELIQGHVQLFRGSAGEKRITIDERLVNIDEFDQVSYLGVQGDRLRLVQVIGNIMSNALKFSQVGSTITVTTAYHEVSFYPPDQLQRQNQRKGKDSLLVSFREKKRNPWVLFSVKDTGPGISAENLEKLFGEGVQFNPNELQGGQGSGLGLWISKGIIELHGGHIWATSEGEGKGCTFNFQLPLVDLDEISAPNKPQGESTDFMGIPQSERIQGELSSSTDNLFYDPSTSSNSFASNVDTRATNLIGKLLIVDDVPMLRKMLKRSLSVKGYDCVEAEDGRECVKMIQDGLSVACILMDFQMPFMNGPDATRELRKLGYKMPIVGVTGNVMPEDVAEFMKAGADTVMVKPFQMDVFQEFIRLNIV